LQTKLPFQLSERSVSLPSTCTQRPTNHFTHFIFFRPLESPSFILLPPLSLYTFCLERLDFCLSFFAISFFYYSQNSYFFGQLEATTCASKLLLSAALPCCGYWVLVDLCYSGLHWPLHAY
jgi:hypothetical protein